MSGLLWREDTPYVSGGKPFTTKKAIKGTSHDELFQSERYGVMSFSIPIPNGTSKVDIHLYFAETFFKSDGSRIFDVKLEGSTVISALDVFVEAGNEAFTAVVKSVMGFEITDGTLDIELTRIRQKPALKAIEIRPSGSQGNPGSFGLETSNISVDRSAGEAQINVLRMLGSNGVATVDYMTRPDTATADDDYVAQAGTLTFGDGVTSQPIVVPLVSGTNVQPTGEQFKIVIDNPTVARLLAPRTATITLLSDSAMLPNYGSFGSDEGLNLNGDARINRRAIELTRNQRLRQAGSAFYEKPISLLGNGSFRTSFSFRISDRTNGAHGLTFTIQNDARGTDALGSIGSGMGFEGMSKAVAVEFDSRRSLVGEITDNHVSIILNSVTNELVQVPANFDLNDRTTYYAWVDFNGNSHSLSVYLSDTETKPIFVLAETTINLEVEVGQTAFVGFTAGTGMRKVNRHEILSWQLDQLEPPFDPPRNPNQSLTQVDLVTGLEEPLSVAWLPGGTMLIAQKSGIVRLARTRDNRLYPTPFIDISEVVNNVDDRGLLDIAVHPDFERNPYVYLLYTYEGIEPPFKGNRFSGPDGIGNRAGRLMRVTADSRNGYRTAIRGSETILLGKNSVRAYFNAFVDSTDDFDEKPGGVRPNGKYVQDFINSDCLSHTVGGLAFSPIDGALFVSIGDGASYNDVDRRAFRVQDIDSLSGKVLRIDPLTGDGLSDNPFYSGNPKENRSKVYHVGLRNPFRLEVDYDTGELFIGEVGWATWEEINSAGEGGGGANFGWPYYEGDRVQQNGYAETKEGRAFFSQSNPRTQVTPPTYALNHVSDGINAIVLGAKLSSDYYGEDLQGNLFVNDLGQGIVRHLSFDSSGKVENVGVFARNAEYFVKIVEGPDGALYYASLVGGRVGRWELI